jgi:putative phage-type endonuclease
MKRETLVPSSEAQWLDWRKADLTSTEAAALFGASPYATEYELYHVKAGLLPPAEFEANERMKWGNRLEAAIAYGIAEDFGIIIEPFKVYMRISDLRMGSSFDFKIVGLADGFSGDESAREMFRRHGPGIMEVKNVDGLQFKRTWLDGEEGIEAPPHIEFQVQHQLEVANLNWSLLSPLVGGNTPKVVIRERDREVGAAITLKVREFWARVAANTPPAPDYTADAETIGRIYVENDGSSVDLSEDFRLIQLCQEYKAAAADEKDAKERKAAAKAEILTIINAAKTITTIGYKISAGTRREVYKAYHRDAGERWTITKSLIPAADIESTTPAYRDVRISEAA